MAIFTLATNKKYLSFAIILIIVLVIVVAIILIFKNYNNQDKPPNRDNLINFLQSQKYEEFIPKDRLEKALNILSNPNSTTDQKYQSLINISFYLQDAYFSSNDPEIRNLLKPLNSKAQKAFTILYNETDFLVACADPECGEKPDTEAKNILNNIQKLPVDELYISIISKNLNNAYYIPYDTKTNKLDKLSLYNLVHQQLAELNSPEASNSAKTLNNYVIKKYNVDISNVNNLTKGL